LTLWTVRQQRQYLVGRGRIIEHNYGAFAGEVLAKGARSRGQVQLPDLIAGNA